ncbi:MAG: hypothetical protein KAS32_23860 [Candidatus Peribacteraceae bacterium]|nr:hypothetical protein [Candidatus Peribacteraceae bacterium]
MSLFLDKTFVNRISHRLEQFTWTRPDVGNCRCPICGDSKKSQSKKRGFFITPKHKKDRLYFKCHNCDAYYSLYDFLEWFDKTIFNEYRTEIFKEKYGDKSKPKSTVYKAEGGGNTNVSTKPEVSVDREIPCLSQVLNNIAGTHILSSLDSTHKAVQYVNSRLIPERFKDRLYYTTNFNYMVAAITPRYSKIPKDERLVIPFFDETGRIIYIQGRSFDDTGLRYLTIPIVDDADKVYGLERIDRTKPVIVVEGPLDSLFIDNCLASADSDLTSVQGDIYTYDNQPRNKEIVEKMKRSINNKYRVTIWDRIRHNAKDINDIILTGITPNEISEYIMKNSPSGLECRIRYNHWKKV